VVGLTAVSLIQVFYLSLLSQGQLGGNIQISHSFFHSAGATSNTVHVSGCAEYSTEEMFSKLFEMT